MHQDSPSDRQEALATVLARSYTQIGVMYTDGHDLHTVAQSYLQKAATLCPDDALAIEGLSNASLRHAASLGAEGNLLGAENFLRKALSLQKNIPLVSEKLAEVLFKRAEESLNAAQSFKAEALLLEVLALNPQHGKAAALLDTASKSKNVPAAPLDQLIAAEAGLRRAQAQNPASPQSAGLLLENLHAQAVQLFNDSRFIEAECAFRKTLALHKVPPTVDGFVRSLCQIAIDLFNNIRFDEAETALWEVLSWQHDNKEATDLLNHIAGVIPRNVPNIMRPDYKACALELRNLLRIKDVVGAPYVRIGSVADGGYVTIDHALNNAVVYSLGVGQDVSWDLEMANKGCQIFLYDHTVESLPAEHPNFHWSKIGIEGKSSPDATFRTIDELIAQNGHKGRKDLILKTDIEAAEWPVFAEMSEETLCQFSQIIGEFHRLARVVDPQYREMMLTALRKINKHFQLVHAHANNFTGMALVAGVPVYYCMEMAFVRRSDHEFTATKRSFPTPLDYPCISRLPDLFLDGFGT